MICRRKVAKLFPGGVLFPREGKEDGSYFWPGNSPDLNPIEHMWATLKARLNSEKPVYTEAALLESAQRIWRDMVAEGIHRRVIANFPERIAAVLDAGGGRTKY